MPILEHGDVSTRYEDTGPGTGFPVLLLAPGGMSATVEVWKNVEYNPLVSLDGLFRLIAMDNRNAGQSRGPLDADDPWGGYVRDQLGVLDALGIERAHVIGCCIGVSLALKMAETAPGRVASMVLEQPIGAARANESFWGKNRRDWAKNLAVTREDFDDATAERFGAAMWDGGEFVVSVSRDFVRGCPVPMLVLPGTDEIHPREIALEIAGLAPDAEVADPWGETPEQLAATAARVQAFLEAHTRS